LWNIWDALPEARALLNAAGPFRAADLIGRLSSENQQVTSMVLLGAKNEH
jgi:hypothetical protein